VAVFDLKLATVTLQDGSGSPNTLAIRVGEGTLSYTEHKNRTYKKDRGKLYKVVNGDDEPIDVSFDLIWEYLRGDSGKPPSPEDAMKQINNASSWVSTDTDTCSPYCIDIITVFSPACIVDKTEKIALPQFRYEQLQYNAKESMIAVSGKCNVVDATLTRV
jgi:hypothetical protein